MGKKLTITGAALLAVMLMMFGTYKLMTSRTYQLFGQLINEVPTTEKAVALTFDDGPTDRVKQLLPLLDKYGVKVTFFLVGKELESHPELGRSIAQAGHQIGNHTYSHNRMVFKSPSYISSEIGKTNELIRQTGYTGSIDFRPPYGKKLVGLPYYLWRNRIDTIMWSIEPDTNFSSPADKVKDVLNNVKPGSIILLHPMYDQTGNELQAMEDIIRNLQSGGYTLVTVEQLRSMRK